MEEQNEKSPPGSSGLNLTVVNSATKEPVVYSGETDDLLCTLTNKTGGDISLQTGSKPSTLEIFLPHFYEQDDLNKMQIKLEDWDFKVNSDDNSLVLTCTQTHAWKSGDALSFEITGAQSSKMPPQGDQAQINPSGMTGNNIPPQVLADPQLSLQKKPDGNKADLRQALEPNLENEGIVYISDSDDLLISNVLSLTLKNTKRDEPLFPGSGPWPSDSHPQALVWFVYNDTAGALAPDEESTPKDQSAWNIQTGEVISEGNVWSFVPAEPKPKHPRWWLTPEANQPGILGTGDQASITFEFTQVVSKTPVGHTQMYVNCSDFPGYNDVLFVLDIDKRELAAQLDHFHSTVDKVTVHSADEKVSIPFSWTNTGVSKITLDFDFNPVPGISLNSFCKTYDGVQPPSQTDNYQLEFSGLKQSSKLTATCNAYDDSGKLLNAQQFDVGLDFPLAVTSYTGELQPDGSLLLNWTTLGAAKVALKSDLNPGFLQANGHFLVQKPPLPLLNNDLYALTAVNDQGKNSDQPVFKTLQKFGAVRPAIGGIGNVPFGIAVSPDNSHVFVVNQDENNVSVIEVNLHENPPFRVLPTPVDTGTTPGGIAVSPDGKYVFVTNIDGNSVTTFGGKPPFQRLPAISAGISPGCLAISPDGRYVLVPNRDSGGLSVIDTTSAFKVIEGPKLDPNSLQLCAKGMAASPNGRYVFVSDECSNLLYVVQVEAGANPPYRVLSDSLWVNAPQGVAVSPDGHYVFVASRLDNSVSVIDLSSGPPFQVLSPPLDAGPSPWALTVSADGRFLFVINGNGVSVCTIDRKSHPPVQRWQTLSVVSPGSIGASPEGYFVFVGNDAQTTISVIEPVLVSM